MISNLHCVTRALILTSAFITGTCQAGTINFTGPLTDVVSDSEAVPSPIFSNAGVGDVLSGSIAVGATPVAVSGYISDKTTNVSFGCCIAAGGLSVSDNYVLTEEDVALLNSIPDSPGFSVGQIIDGINIEGDASTTGGGRIEVGLSYIFSASTFSNENFSNYPFDPGDVLLDLYFIVEEDSSTGEIFNAVGAIVDRPQYNVAVDYFSVQGNPPCNVIDDFDDGNLAPLWEIFEPTVVESGTTASFNSPGIITPPVQFGAINNFVSEMSHIGSIESGPLQCSNGSGDFIGSSQWAATLPSLNQIFGMGVSNLDGEDISIGVYNFDSAFAEAFGVPQGLGVLFGRFGDVETGNFETQGNAFASDDVTGDIILSISFSDATDMFLAAYSLDGGSTFITPYSAVAPSPGALEFGWYMGTESFAIGDPWLLACDLNENGKVDAGDLTQVERMVMGAVADDLDCDLNNSGNGDGVISTPDILSASRIVFGNDQPVYRLK